MSSDEILQSALKKAAAGKATTMTPDEMDAFRGHSQAKAALHAAKKKEEAIKARGAFSSRELEVHDFMDELWSRHSSSGYNPDIHDPLVLRDAALKFGIAETEAQDTYRAVEDAILKAQTE